MQVQIFDRKNMYRITEKFPVEVNFVLDNEHEIKNSRIISAIHVCIVQVS